MVLNIPLSNLGVITGINDETSTEEEIYTALAVNFDGTTYLNRNSALTNIAGKGGYAIVSFWFRATDTNNQNALISDGATYGFLLGHITISSLKRLYFYGTDTNADFYDESSIASFDDFINWNHLLFKLDVDNNIAQCYINDLDATPSVPEFTADSLDLTSTNWLVGNNLDFAPYSGDLADLFVDFGTDLDLSVESNRRKFINASGKPVNLGSDGSNPLGHQPTLFFSGNATTFATNKGYGGDFTTENGSLTNASTSPSD